MKVSSSSQTCALGAAICGAVVGGAYKKIEQAAAKMTSLKDVVYKPNPAAVKVYAKLYKLYMALHDAFGTACYDGKLNHVLKELIAIRNAARK